MSARNFFAELKRRNVYRVAVAYTVVAWLIIQVSATIFPAFNAPSWVLKVIILLLGLGFFLAVALAWAFEITATGIKRTEDVTPQERRAPPKGRLIALTAIVAAVAVALLLIGSTRVQRAVTGMLASAGIRMPGSPEINRKSIAN